MSENKKTRAPKPGTKDVAPGAAVTAAPSAQLSTPPPTPTGSTVVASKEPVLDSKAGTVTQSQERRLGEIKDEIGRHQYDYAQSYIEIGRLLIEAKAIFGKKHGDWITWTKSNIDLSVTKVQRLMRVARRFEKKAPVPFLEYTKAYTLTVLTEPDMKNFMAVEHNVNGVMKSVAEMSKRELEEAVRDHLKSLRAESDENSSPQNSDDNDEGDTETASKSTKDIFTMRIESVKDFMATLVKFCDEHASDEDFHAVFASELREIFDDTIAKFPSEDLEGE